MDSSDFSNKLSSGINGVTGILNTAMPALQINDNYSEYDDYLANMRSVGVNPYTSFDQIVNDHSLVQKRPVAQFDKIRGMTGGQKAMNIISSGLTGAAAGAAVGGAAAPYTTLAGLVAGLGISGGMIAAGDAKARDYVNSHNTDSLIAMNNANLNIGASTEDYLNKTQSYNLRKDGGKIKSIGIQDYAAKVLRQSHNGDRPKTSGIIRQHCKGGTMIRIKR